MSFNLGTMTLRHEDTSSYVTLEYVGPETRFETYRVKTPVKAEPHLLWLYEKSLVNDVAASFWLMSGPAQVLYSALMEWLNAQIDACLPGHYGPMRIALANHEERVRALYARYRIF